MKRSIGRYTSTEEEIESIEDEILDLYKRLPIQFLELYRQGKGLLYDKSTDRYYVYVGEGREGRKKVYVPKKYKTICEEIRRLEIDKERLEAILRLESKKQDESYILELRKLALDRRKPILTKEIESQSWWHNLLLDVGRMTVLLVLPNLGFDLARLNEEVMVWNEKWEELSNRIIQFVWSCIQAKERAYRIQELEEMVRVLEADNEFLKIELEKQKMILDSALMSMDEPARRRFLLYLALKYLMRGGRSE